ncbi:MULTISPECIES: hypothetical protein [Rhodanobacter]|uniref:hypothetical protein n=2 Tax=Rhodanobacter TaxID=75309 RepID=UPI00128FE08F|nr:MULTISPECIES: hypothetical protein [unclassified Rhodanobacter]
MATDAAVRGHCRGCCRRRQFEACVTGRPRRIAAAGRVAADCIAACRQSPTAQSLCRCGIARMPRSPDMPANWPVVCAGMSPAPGIRIFTVTFIFIMLPESDRADAAAASDEHARSAEADRQRPQ